MDDFRRTKEELVSELARLRHRIADLAASESKRQMEESQWASETQYRRLFEAGRDGILILDADTGEITAVNSFLTDLLGYSQKDMLGKQLWEIGSFEDIEASKIAFLELQSRDYIHYEDLPLRTRDGRSIAVEFVSNVYLTDEKKVIKCNIRDVTERKRADAQLRLQSAALNAAADAIVITDRAGLIQWVNPAFSDLTGYTAAEAAGRDLRELVKSGRHDQAFYKDLWDTILSGQPWRGEIINRRKDGSLYTEEQAITPLRDPQGVISHFIAVKQDITERKRAEGELHQRAQLSALRAAVGLSLTNANSLAGALQQCAEALVTHLGIAFTRIWTVNAREGVIELQASARLDTEGDGPQGEDLPEHFEIGRIARERKPHLVNTVVGDLHVSGQNWSKGMAGFAGHPLLVDGRLVGVMAVFARHPLSDEVIAAMASVADHIALGIERHRSADALRAAEERMRFALQNANVGIWDMDYATGALRWSETLEAQYGLLPGTFGGTFDAFAERLHPDDRTSVLESIANAMRSGTDFSVLHRTIWPDGTVRWLNGMGRVLLGEHGEPLRGVGISLDVTERRRADDELTRLNDEIQLQRLRVFKATMRTVQDIVNNLFSSLQLVHLEVEGELPAQMLTLVDRMIQEAAARLKALGDLETIKEKEMVMGMGIDYPGSSS